MKSGKKAEPFDGKWAIVTIHPSLPSRSEQIARARAWGVVESTLGRADISALFVDDVSKVGRTTNWAPHLKKRATFLEKMEEIRPVGDQVFFANPLCVGFSAKHAEETMRALWDRGFDVYIHSVHNNGPAIYAEGDDLTEFSDMVAKAANAAYQRKDRAKKSKSE